MGSKPAPLLVLARYGRLQKSQEQKTKTKKKNQLHRFLYKTIPIGTASALFGKLLASP